MRYLFSIVFLLFSVEAKTIEIVKKPIIFQKKRIDLTKEYIWKHYGIHAKSIQIQPKIIVLHWTTMMTLQTSYNFLKNQTLRNTRPDISKAGALNVSAHYLVDRDGTIYELMPDNKMARHVIGLNYSAIGIENVGGRANKEEDLTKAQLKSNILLVEYLVKKYPEIKYLIGHYEYKKMQKTSLWLEKDKSYRTYKVDPGKRFMKAVRKAVQKLGLKQAPK